MTTYEVTLRTKDDRDMIGRIAQAAPWGTRVRFVGAQRTYPQNSKMWAMLTEIATQVKWCDQQLSPDDWKTIFLHSLKRELRCVPNLEGNGIVVLGRSSSSLTKQDMSDMIELMHAFGAEHGVRFADRQEAPPDAA